MEQIGCVTFSRFQSDRKVIPKKTKKTTNRTKNTILFLDLFVLCLKIVSKHYPEKFETFLRQIWNPDEGLEETDEDDSFFDVDYRRKVLQYFRQAKDWKC